MFCIIDSIYGKGGYYFLLHFTTHFEERRSCSAMLPGGGGKRERAHFSLCVYHIIYDTMMKLKSRPIQLQYVFFTMMWIDSAAAKNQEEARFMYAW